MLFIPIASVDPLWSNADIVGGIIPVMPSTIKPALKLTMNM